MTIPTSLRILLSALFCVAAAGNAAGLPDTGQDTCFTDSATDGVLQTDPESVARDTGSHPRQDCRYGRDAAAVSGVLTKTGAGKKGFDYTKIANNGTVLPADTGLGTANTAWACTRDNVTGLTWEVKTATNTDLRFDGLTYSWYNPLALTNGGSAGDPGNFASCSSTLSGNLCNTQAYAAVVNAAQLCSYTDWRLPTRRELLTLVNAAGVIPAVVFAFFPYTSSSSYWSGSTYVPTASEAWSVDYFAGISNHGPKTTTKRVMLVRGELF